MTSRALSDSQRRELLQHVASLEPDADTTDAIASVFLPLPEYQRVLDDRVVLVLGERGVGKSALFHFLQSAARPSLEQPGYPPHEWIVGFSETGSEHPSPLVLEELVSGAEDAEVAARGFWLGHLAGRISEGLNGAVVAPPLLDRWRAEPTDPRAWSTAVTDPTPVLLWLDQVERQLLQEQRTLVVTYDHLDKIGVRNRDVRRRILPPLLALWLSLSNRYRAIRAKIFLRQDLFRESVPHTADVSKLQARAETIRWTNAALFRLLLRHLASRHASLRDWITDGVNQIRLREDPRLGWVPPDDLPETGSVSQQAFMNHLVGPTMGGKDPRAGYPHRWVMARLSDANQAITPRSIVTLFKSSASHAVSVGPRAGYLRLLTPDELKEGLRETSTRRVTELAEEHPVIERLAALAEYELPLGSETASELLSRQGQDERDGFARSGDRVLDELGRLGVISRVGKDRIDIPDIFRLHFRIRRTGQKVAVSRFASGR